MKGCVILAALFAVAIPAQAEVIRVCPERAKAADCRFTGDGAIQAAVDAAADGDVILIARGRYSPRAYRDVPFQDVAVRAFVHIRGKRLGITGEDGAILDGGQGIPASAFVVQDAEVAFTNLEIDGFRYAEQEDKIYDGHGIFAINSRVDITQVTMRGIVKMGLTGRGDSLLRVRGMRFLEGHIGFWLDESAHADVHDMLIQGGDSAGIAAYGRSTGAFYNIVVTGKSDDGIFADDEATLFVSNAVLAGNKPFAVNADKKGRVTVVHSAFHGNAADANPAFKEQLQLATGILELDPMLDANGRPHPGSPLAGRTDPDFGRPIGLTEMKR